MAMPKRERADCANSISTAANWHYWGAQRMTLRDCSGLQLRTAQKALPNSQPPMRNSKSWGQLNRPSSRERDKTTFASQARAGTAEKVVRSFGLAIPTKAAVRAIGFYFR